MKRLLQLLLFCTVFGGMASGLAANVESTQYGGVYRSSSEVVSYNPYGYGTCTVRSSPEGALVETTSRVTAPGETVTTVALDPRTTAFAYWTVNGVAQRDASGMAVRSVTLAMPTYDVEIVAVGEANALTRAKLFWYGNSYQSDSSDTDGDGLTLAQEVAQGTSPCQADQSLAGGVYRAGSVAVTYNIDGSGTCTIRSEPEGALFETSSSVRTRGETVTTEALSPTTSGFAYWTVNGVAQRAADGSALRALSFTMPANDVEVVAVTESDATRRAKLFWYGSATQSDSSDTDGDGLTLAQEVAMGTSPRQANQSIAGGVYRGSKAVVYKVDGEYAIRYNKNDGTGATVSEKVTCGAGHTLKTCVGTLGWRRTGYVFAGWSYMKASSSVNHADGASVKSLAAPDETIDLFAVWLPDECQIVFGKNGGTGGDDSLTATYRALPRNIIPPTRAGYAFGGYWTTTGSGGVQYFDDTGCALRVWDKLGSATLWAKWTACVYRITFGKNGGSGGDERVTVAYAAKPHDVTIPKRPGYSFEGYWTTTGTGGVQYFDAVGRALRVWDRAANVKLWAKWREYANTRVTFGKNGGAGGDSYATVKFGVTPHAIAVPTRPGYVFEGYWTTTGTGGVRYFAKDGSPTRVWDKTSDCTLWAKWTPISYRLTFGKGGGAGGDQYVTVPFGTQPHAITPPTRAGWIFDGYWTSLPGGSEIYFADGAATGKWTGTANLTLVAKWTQGTAYQVTFDKRGGTGGGAYVRVARGVAMPRIVLPTRTGYTFAGYWTTPSGEGVQHYRADGTSARNWNAAKGGTLYARWVAK